MRAAVVHGPEDLRVDDLPEPTVDAGEVLLAVEWGGICGSDIAYWRHARSGTASLTAPLVLGHEFAGTIVEVGSGVDEALVGRRATVHPGAPSADSVLPDRLAGRTNLHSQVRYFGSAALEPHTDGGFRERVSVREHQLRLLPEAVDTKSGALAEPLAVAMHAVGRVGAVAGMPVLVNGAGPVGCLVVAVLKRAGARVTVADISAGALAIAAQMGADTVIDVSSGESLPSDVPVVFETSGAAAAIGGVLRATARGGTLVQVGNLPGDAVPIAVGDLVTREITWIGSFRFVDEITDAIEALATGLDVTPIMTHEFALADVVEAVRTAADRRSGSSKVMLDLRAH